MRHALASVPSIYSNKRKTISTFGSKNARNIGTEESWDTNENVIYIYTLLHRKLIYYIYIYIDYIPRTSRYRMCRAQIQDDLVDSYGFLTNQLIMSKLFTNVHYSKEEVWLSDILTYTNTHTNF